MPAPQAKVKWLVSMASPDQSRAPGSVGFVGLDEAKRCAEAGFCEILEELKPPKKERAVKK